MQEPTCARPNKFVQVPKQDDGFTAEAGKRTSTLRQLADDLRSGGRRGEETLLGRISYKQGLCEMPIRGRRVR